jgi:hypothetical protein
VFEFDNVEVRGLTAPVAGGAQATPAAAQVTQTSSAATGNGQLILIMCHDLESTITLFHDGQILKQESLRGHGANVYDLEAGHYDLQFNTQGYANLNVDFDIIPGGQVVYYIDSDKPC